MSIARELVTRLSFAFDKTNLDKFERAISGFKTKFDIARLSIERTFGRLIDFSKEWSNNILKNDAIAKFTKTSLSDLDALQKAFQKADISPDAFTNFFEDLSRQIVDAKYGALNNFQSLVSESGGVVRKNVNGELTTAKQAIYDFRNFIKGVVGEQKQLRYVQNFFNLDLQQSEAIRKLLTQNDDAWTAMIEKERLSVQELENNKQKAIQFKKEINNLEVEWSKFQSKVASFTVPLIGEALGGANAGLNAFQDEDQSILGLIHDAYRDLILSFFGKGQLDETKRKLIEDEADFLRRYQQQETAKINERNAAITNNVRFDFNVPPGTTEQQATFLSDSVRNSFNQVWDEKIREVINNNPVVE